MVDQVLTPKALNKVKNVFIKQTTKKIAAVRSIINNISDQTDLSDEFEEIYLVFHSLMGTGKSIGFAEITDIAAGALDTIKKARQGSISVKLFRAKIEASLCEIEEYLPNCLTETASDSVNNNTKDSGAILVIDDDVALVQAIKERLSVEGFRVYGASTFKEALSYISQKQQVDLFIIDIIMPEGSGFELCRIIRGEKIYEDTPIVFLTAETSFDKKLESYEIGGDDYVTKPVSLHEIALKARAIIERTKKIKSKLLYDELTGAYNRSFLDVKFSEEKARCIRNKGYFGLCLLDVDRFKHVNDTYGHQAGDQVLVGFVSYLKSNIRDSDAVIRYGGEEFILILSQINPDNIIDTVNRLRLNFAKKTFVINDTAFLVTFSAGVAVFPTDGYTMEDLLYAADKALYNAKRSGRNETCCYQGS